MTRRSSIPVEATPLGDCGSLGDGALTSDQAIEAARLLGALGDPVRLRMLSMIAVSGEVCSCDLELPLGKSQPTISHHTSVLADVGLITGEKRGRWMWWRVVPGRLDEVTRLLSLPSP